MMNLEIRSNIWKVFVTTLWFFVFTKVVISKGLPESCNRIYFQWQGKSNSDIRPMFKSIENNIFAKTAWTTNKFPIYKAERASLYFFYNLIENKFVFSRGRYFNEYKDRQVPKNKYVIFSKLTNINSPTLLFGKKIFVGVKNLHQVCVSSGKSFVRKRRSYDWDDRRWHDGSWNADAYEGLREAAIIIGCILPFLVPLVHWCIKAIREEGKNDSKEALLGKSCTRIYSFHFYIGSVLWAIFLIIGAAIHIFQYGDDTFWALSIVGYAMTGFGVLFVWIESCCSREASYLSKKFDTDQASDLLNVLLETWPSITVHTVSYHYETRTRQVSYTDSNGNTQYRTETYTVRVDTHSDECQFEYSSCKDTSDVEKMPEIGAKGVTFMKLGMHISLADEETVAALEATKSLMIEKNSHRDTYIDCSVKETVENYREHFMIGDPDKGVPEWMDNGAFAVASLFWCSWPYRYILNKHSKRKEFEYFKELSVIAGQPVNNGFSEVPMNTQHQCIPPPISTAYGWNAPPTPSTPGWNAPQPTAPGWNVQNKSANRVGVPLSSIPMYTSCAPEDAPPSYESLQVEKRY